MPPSAADQPLVTFFTSTYNSGPPVEQAVDSMLAQTYPNLEVVVIDDGSRDGTPDRLRRYGDRIRFMPQANGGIARARNACMEAARGDYIAWFDHDDINEPQRIAWQMALMRAQPDLVLCSSGFSSFDARGAISPSHAAAYYKSISSAPGGLRDLMGEPGEIELALDGCPALPGGRAGAAPGSQVFDTYRGNLFGALALGNFVHPPTILMKRELWAAVGAFDPSIRIHCDYEWLLRASRVGPFGYLDAPLIRYRLSATQSSGSRNDVLSADDICEIVDRIAKWDPAFHAEHRDAMRRRQAMWRINASCALADTDRAKARRLLMQGIRGGYFTKQTLRAIAKNYLPRAVVARFRQGA